jgi:hypothetical protein
MPRMLRVLNRLRLPGVPTHEGQYDQVPQPTADALQLMR